MVCLGVASLNPIPKTRKTKTQPPGFLRTTTITLTIHIPPWSISTFRRATVLYGDGPKRAGIRNRWLSRRLSAIRMAGTRSRRLQEKRQPIRQRRGLARAEAEDTIIVA